MGLAHFRQPNTCIIASELVHRRHVLPGAPFQPHGAAFATPPTAPDLSPARVRDTPPHTDGSSQPRGARAARLRRLEKPVVANRPLPKHQANAVSLTCDGNRAAPSPDALQTAGAAGAVRPGRGRPLRVPCRARRPSPRRGAIRCPPCPSTPTDPASRAPSAPPFQ